MSENHQSFSDRQPEEGLGNRRYDSMEKLITWSIREGDYFIFYRVKSFREIMLPSNREVEPSFESAECVSSEAPSCGWKFHEYDADTNLQYNRARCFDPTPGRWVPSKRLATDCGSWSAPGT